MLKDIRSNPVMLTDAYNTSHERLKTSVDWEVSHMYNRAKGMFLFGFKEIVTTILNIQITKNMVLEAESHAEAMGLVFPTETWMRVVNELDGYLPLEVQSLPEGTYCPAGTPFAQIRNTVEGFGDLVTWLEPIFMMSYFPCTTATQGYRMRKYLERKQRQYGYDDSFLYRFHSFGFRGHRSLEDAYWAGVSWNLSLLGTDDFHTKMHFPSAEVVSISALAHKVTQQFDDEYEGLKHAIKSTADDGKSVVALVIDTYDADRVINEYLLPLAQFADRHNVTIVMRPDSGDTWKQVVDMYRIVERNKLTNVGAIIGESMDFENAKKADVYFEEHSVPLNFVSYGIGSGFYNYITRDTLGFAMKTSYSNGAPRMKFSMIPLKRSIPNKVVLDYNTNGDLIVGFEENDKEESMYETIYYNTKDYSFIDLVDHNHFKMVQERMAEQSIEQHQIFLEPSVHELIRSFEKQYKN